MSASEAFRVARERASVAAALEASTLHTAIYDAREAGMSVRETATYLRVPKSTIARHWREGHRCAPVIPTWGSESAWHEAHAAIWAHDPDELADDFIPYEWADDGGQRIVRARARGRAILRSHAPTVEILPPDSCAGGNCGHCAACLARIEAKRTDL